MPNKRPSDCAVGFTLIELSIIIVIIGLLMSAALQAYSTYLKTKQVEITKENILDARRQIEAFRAKYGYFPCPADPAVGTGQSTDCTNPAENNPPSLYSVPIAAPFVPGHTIRIGVVPVSAVIDPDGAGPLPLQTVRIVAGERSVDGWKNRLAYAVIEQMAVPPPPGGAGSDGSITVNEVGALAAGPGNRKYVVFSYGEDGIGAYSLSGAQRQQCVDGAAVDSENCDGDAVFVDLGPSDVRSTTRNANNYDDFLESDVMQNACIPPQIVIDIAADGSPICSNPVTCNPGTYFVGLNAAGDPVCNAIPVCPSGQFLSFNAAGAPICNPIQGCPGGSLSGFDAAGAPVCVSSSHSCPNPNQYIVSVDVNGNAACANRPPDVTGSDCNKLGPNLVLRGFDDSGNPICVPLPTSIQDIAWPDQHGDWKQYGDCAPGYSPMLWQYHPGGHNNADVLLCVKR